MIEIVREFIVKEEVQGHFELAFGPGGAWSKLFAQFPGFRGTTVMRDVKNPLRYLTIDLWETVEQWEQMLIEREAEYSELEITFVDWTESRKELGIFKVRAEATVRPHSKIRRSKAGKTHRWSR